MKPKTLELGPDRGSWTVDEYLRLDFGRHVEFSSGTVEFQPMPDEKHQAILFVLVKALKAFAARQGGKATMAPFPVRLWEGKFRQPDAAFMRKENLHRCHLKFWDGADIAMEVLSESNRDLDLEVKRGEYARAGIPEYWIIDRENREITVLTLRTDQYVLHGRFTGTQRAASLALGGFEVAVSEILAAE